MAAWGRLKALLAQLSVSVSGPRRLIDSFLIRHAMDSSIELAPIGERWTLTGRLLWWLAKVPRY